ncbi:hypothetical protein C6A85_12110, partial [Mycobacterium sp. ITM-2017-0098]
GAFFAVTVGILGLMGGLLQINPVWVLGPYKPSQVSAGSQPDFTANTGMTRTPTTLVSVRPGPGNWVCFWNHTSAR